MMVIQQSLATYFWLQAYDPWRSISTYVSVVPVVSMPVQPPLLMLLLLLVLGYRRSHTTTRNGNGC